MTADDAFDRLVEKNALNIPVAKPSSEGRYTEQLASLDELPTGAHRVAEDNPETIRVLDILDGDETGDYQPHNYGDDSEEFSTPTETDLDTVQGDEFAEAYAAGAQVLGRDIDADEFFGDIEANQERVGRDTEVEDLRIPRAPSAPQPVSASLDKARRFRRFSYLPIVGIDKFELRARDIMSSLSARTPEKPSLAITSTERGSGQVELALRLALAIGRRVDYRVLLADFDIRRPSIAKRLGLSSKYFTITDVLRGSCPLGEALMMSEEDNLYVLPARQTDRDGDEILNDRQVQALIGQMHEAFDFVILNCGPMDHADATIICRHAGAAAVAAFCSHSSARRTRDCAVRLSEAGVNVAGLLLAGTH